MLDLRCGEGMEGEPREARLDRAEGLLEPGEGQFRVEPALEHDLRGTYRHGLGDLGEDRPPCEQVGFRMSRLAEEGAEAAPRDAHVGVVDVAVHAEGANRLRV